MQAPEDRPGRGSMIHLSSHLLRKQSTEGVFCAKGSLGLLRGLTKTDSSGYLAGQSRDTKQDGAQLHAQQSRSQGPGCNQFRRRAIEAGGRDRQRPGEGEGSAFRVIKRGAGGTV